MVEIDYRKILSDAFAERQQRNARYSMRAFARDIDISPQKLSMILSSKTGLSPASAEAIATKLALTGTARSIFITAVEAAHHRSQQARQAAAERLRLLVSATEFKTIDASQAVAMKEWYYWAISVLVDLEGFKPEIPWISSKLQITEAQAKAAVDDLFNVGILQQENDTWVRSAQKARVRAATPSTELRTYYRQLWALAEKTLDSVPVDQRDFSAMMVSVGLDDVGFIREEIDAFHKSLIEKISKRPGNAEAVYAVAIQLFPVTTI